MKIIIVGAGEVGTHLAKMLSRLQHDITLIDEDGTKLRKAQEGSDLMTIVGSPTSIKDLTDAGVKSVDLFIAVTPHESQNLTACLLAANLGAKRRVARIDNSEYMDDNCRKFFDKMGINALIYPEKLAAEEIITSLRVNWVRQWMEFGDGALTLIAMKVRGNAPIINKKLKDLTGSDHYRIVAIRRDSDTIIPKGDSEIKTNDIVYFFTTNDYVTHVRNEAGKEVINVKDLIIMGGSKIAVQTCESLPSGMNVKVIEKDKALARTLSEELDAMVINSDASNPEILRQEDIEDMDAFVALTDNSEANILACLEAKQLGIKKTIAEVENISYIPLAEKLDIGTVINKKLIAASHIYQYTLDIDVSKVNCLTHVDAEVVELTAKEGSKITQSKIMDLKLPHDIFIGGFIRGGVGEIANGNTQIQTNDSVIVFCLSASLTQLDKLFK